MRIKNKAAAKRAGVCPKTLSRWDKRYEEVGYARPIFVLGQIYRETDEIDEFERKNPEFGRRPLPRGLHRTKQNPPKQAKSPKQRKVRDRAAAKSDRRFQ